VAASDKTQMVLSQENSILVSDGQQPLATSARQPHIKFRSQNIWQWVLSMAVCDRGWGTAQTARFRAMRIILGTSFIRQSLNFALSRQNITLCYWLQ